jgi:rhodanese-related sulfurtransferase
MWPDLDAYGHSGHWSIVDRCSTLLGMTQAELAYEHFTHRLAVETDADDVGSALQDGSADFVLIDARSPAAYAAAHLPGALSYPHRGLTKETLDELPDGPIVVYCWGPGCNAATKAAARISALGRDVKEMIGGFEYYVREGYPVEGEQAERHRKDESGLVTLTSEAVDVRG